jgi:hypothetical protein
MHPHEETALAIGYKKWSDDEWLNSFGGSFSGSPADIPWDVWKGVLIRHFESYSRQADGSARRFWAEYRPDMSPSEVCKLVLRIEGTR